MNLDLKERTDTGPSPSAFDSIEVGDRVRLHSEGLDCSLDVEVTHTGTDQLGGNLKTEPDTPYLESGDHVHFGTENVLGTRE